MDPVVNTQSVDQFFDTPTASEPFDGGELAGDFSGDTSTTEFYTPPDKNLPAPEPAPAPEEPAPAPVPPPQPADVDYVAENQRLQQQLAELQLYKPLGEMISRNPKFLEAVESSLKSLPSSPPEAPRLERPTAPVKPAAYDPTEALSVPGSESWKYREATESFANEMFGYYEKRDQIREEAQQKAIAQYEQQMQLQHAHDQLTNELQTQYGYTPERVQDFIKVMSDPASRSIGNLVALHAMQLQKQAAASQGAVKAAQKNVPLPVGIAGGGGGGQTKQLTESDSFNLGLMSARR